jgi:hypothetical protein
LPLRLTKSKKSLAQLEELVVQYLRLTPVIAFTSLAAKRRIRRTGLEPNWEGAFVGLDDSNLARAEAIVRLLSSEYDLA